MSVTARLIHDARRGSFAVMSLALVCAALAWTVRDSQPFSVFVWRAVAGIMTAGFAIIGIVLSAEWRRIDYVWLVATLSGRLQTVLSHIAWAYGAVLLVTVVTGVAMWPALWLAASVERTAIWFFTAAAAAISYLALGYNAGLAFGRAAPLAVTLLWGYAFLEPPLRQQLAAAARVLRMVVPPFDLYAPHGLGADFPISPEFIYFVIGHSAAVVVFWTAVSYLLIRRADLPYRTT